MTGAIGQQEARGAGQTDRRVDTVRAVAATHWGERNKRRGEGRGGAERRQEGEISV